MQARIVMQYKNEQQSKAYPPYWMAYTVLGEWGIVFPSDLNSQSVSQSLNEGAK